MADATPPAVLSAFEKMIDREIQDGFPNEQPRRAEQLRVLNYFNLEGGKYIKPRRGETKEQFKDRPKQVHPLTRRVIKILCSKTYSPGPSRTIGDDEAADKALQEVYRDNNVDQIMGAADEVTTLLFRSAIQVVDVGSESLKPIQLRLWDASQLVLYADPADPTRCISLVTIDCFDHQTRYRWWTDRFVRTYLTQKVAAGQTSGGRVATFQAEEAHGYGRLPFGLIFSERPTDSLDGEGLGRFLADRNAAIDLKIDRMDAAVVAYHVPREYIFNCPPAWNPTGCDDEDEPWEVGNSIRVPANRTENGTDEVRIEYPQADLDIESGWLDIEKAIDTVMEGLGVPQTLYRMNQASLPSGESQKAEQQPLVDYTEKRRELFKAWETDLAEAILAVKGVKYKNAAATEAGQRGLNLSLRWPPEDPTIEEMQADDLAMEDGSTSLVMVTQKRNRFASRDEAIQHLKQVAQDNEELLPLGLGPLAKQQQAMQIANGQPNSNGNASGTEPNPTPTPPNPNAEVNSNG